MDVDRVDNISQYNVCWCYYIALYQEQIRSLSLSDVQRSLMLC